jgi:hypothetical protein
MAQAWERFLVDKKDSLLKKMTFKFATHKKRSLQEPTDPVANKLLTGLSDI